MSLLVTWHTDSLSRPTKIEALELYGFDFDTISCIIVPLYIFYFMFHSFTALVIGYFIHFTS